MNQFKTVHMNKIAIIFGLIILMTSCNLIENKEEKAIEVCQNAKVQYVSDNIFANLFLDAYGLGANANWLDFANMQAKKDPNNKYSWIAEKTIEENIYLVGFVDQKGWGQQWEVDIEQQIVKFVNQNEYLSRKYGLSRFDNDGNFQVTKITTDTMKLVRKNSSQEIVYFLKASIVNKTGKTLTDANISGKLQVVFKDKTVEGASDYQSGFRTKVSKSRPWKTDTEKDFYIKTIGVEIVYLDYEPEYVFFEVNVEAEDPIGFSYDKNIAEYDLKNRWETLKL